MPFLRQSTSQVVRFGPCLDKGDGVTEETGLTLAQADMRLSKDGAAFAQKSAAGNATHDSDGWYSTTLSTTDTATVGELRLNVHQPANMLPVWDRWWVLEEAVYDAVFGASAAGPLQSTVAGRTLDVTTGGAAGIDWGNVENPTTVLDLSATDIQLVDTVTTYTGNTLQTGDVTTAIDDLANATDGLGALKTLIDTVNTDLSNGTDGLGALKTLIDTVNTDLSNGTDGLGALKTLIDTVNTDLSNGTDGLGALKTLIDALNDYDPTAQITESYAANGVAPTRDQLDMAVHQMLMQFGAAGTSLTVRKLDDTTTAFVVTLDDSTSPTDAKRV